MTWILPVHRIENMLPEARSPFDPSLAEMRSMGNEVLALVTVSSKSDTRLLHPTIRRLNLCLVLWLVLPFQNQELCRRCSKRSRSRPKKDSIPQTPGSSVISLAEGYTRRPWRTSSPVQSIDLRALPRPLPHWFRWRRAFSGGYATYSTSQMGRRVFSLRAARCPTSRQSWLHARTCSARTS